MRSSKRLDNWKASFGDITWNQYREGFRSPKGVTSLWKPVCGTTLLGNSIWRGFGALKGLSLSRKTDLEKLHVFSDEPVPWPRYAAKHTC